MPSSVPKMARPMASRRFEVGAGGFARGVQRPLAARASGRVRVGRRATAVRSMIYLARRSAVEADFEVRSCFAVDWANAANTALLALLAGRGG